MEPLTTKRAASTVSIMMIEALAIEAGLSPPSHQWVEVEVAVAARTLETEAASIVERLATEQMSAQLKVKEDSLVRAVEIEDSREGMETLNPLLLKTTGVQVLLYLGNLHMLMHLLGVLKPAQDFPRSEISETTNLRHGILQ